MKKVALIGKIHSDGINILKNNKLVIKSDDDYSKLGDINYDGKAAFYLI